MHLSPEWQLLLACASANSSREDVYRLVQACHAMDLDWDHLAETACQHGIAPLVYHHLQSVGATESLAPSARDTLQNFSYRNAVRNALLYKDLQAILMALQAIQVEVIVLKGAALAEMVYHHRSLRPMGDVDLLVRRQDVSRVEAKLGSVNYLLSEVTGTKAWYEKYHYHVIFQKHAATPTAIPYEIHWDLERPRSPFTIDIAGLWERAVPASIAHVEALVLCPEDLLLHLCLHTCQDNFSCGLRSLCDISETIRQYGHTINWEHLQTRSYQWRINRCVYLVLRLTRELLGAAVPDSLLDALTPEDLDPRLLAWTQEQILAVRTPAPIPARVA